LKVLHSPTSKLNHTMLHRAISPSFLHRFTSIQRGYSVIVLFL